MALTNSSRPRDPTSSNTKPDLKSMNGPINTAFGNTGHPWDSNSIWGGGRTNGLSSAAATRDRLVSRDTAQKSIVSPVNEIQGKIGSGSLVDSSISEDYPTRAPWAAFNTRNSVSGRYGTPARYEDTFSFQQRSTSHAGISHSVSSGNQDVPAFTSRPSTININSTASGQVRQSYGSTFASGMTGRPGEQPPFNVYTKFDRPTDHSQKKPDSAIGGWAETVMTPSPSDERRQAFFTSFSRTTSMPTSRDGSLPPSRHGSEAPIFTQPDYSGVSQKVTPSSSRAPSISSIRNGGYNGFFGANTDNVAHQFGQLELQGDSRPSTSYRQHQESTGHSGGSTPSTGGRSINTRPASFDTRSPDDRLQGNMNQRGFGQPNQFPQHHSASRGLSGPSIAERYFQPGNTYEFRPGQPYGRGSVSARAYGIPENATPAEWHHIGSFNVATNRRYPTDPEQQAFLDTNIQPLMATEGQDTYSALYSPYALPGLLQLSAPSPYASMMSLNMPGIDPSMVPHDSPVGDSVQSALMYEFRTNTKTKRYDLRDIYDHIAEFSNDQHGSRFIQTKLETANSDEKERVFREIQPNAIPLMTDVFGNYVIQKFFEHGDQMHKKILANKMRGQVLQLSLQMYGCRVVQKALDHVLVDQQASLISELENHVLKCVKDQNGNHVIQKAIERCPSSTIGFIIAAFRGQVQHLSIHPYGCRVIQRCLEKQDLPSRAMVLSELMENIQTMISDQFGNYVVQHIVAHDDGEPKRRVLSIVARGLEGYSKHKFASNVVEKCLEKSDDAWRRQIVFSLAQSLQRREFGEGILAALIKDNYGNYVIQKLLDTLCADDYFHFLEMLQPAMAFAKRTGCGKQVISIDKKMHRFDSFRSGRIDNSHLAFQSSTFRMQLATPSYMNDHNSASTTPPSLTADSQSLQSSCIASVNGDAVEGATAGEKSSDPLTKTEPPPR